MTNPTLVPVSGVIQRITPLSDDCCSQQVSIQNKDGISNFIIGPATYVINEDRMRPGMPVTAFYDANLPIPLIYPPTYQAVIIGRQTSGEMIYAGYFNEQLVSADNTLQIVPAQATEITTSNGQPFACSPVNQLLIIFYTAATKSIPAQTTPRRIIVIC